ncbi:unnamed protein product [Malus baccata var. baccata]
MRLLTWNCQGIGGDLTVDNLLEQNRLHTPDIVVLLETKNKSSRYGYLKKRLDLEYMHAVEPRNIGGGLCVFWRDATQVTLVKRLENNRGKTLLIGDFNDILCNDEKEGGNYRPTASMRDFREFVAQNELMDLGFEAKPIQQRLDRGLATMEWQNLYPENTIRHVVLEGSDHALLFLSTEKEDEAAISTIATSYFEVLFKSSRPGQIDEIGECPAPRVTTEDNLALTTAVTEEEIKTVVFQIPPTRAPGPDGYSGCFYQDHWDTVGKDVIRIVKAFWHSGTILRKLNHTNLVLIPKVKCPRNMTQYRPIALCNVIYKVIAKVLSNRLKTVMPKAISDNQSAFILHSLLHQKNGDKTGMAIKLDMAKAYDRVEWVFLLSMMAKLGFAPLFCHWIKECISTASFSILVNGNPTGFVLPERGLRQGDPLSPYLFLLCTEGLSMLIRRGIERGALHGFSVSAIGNPISHLFFADDSVLFGHASVEEARGMVEVLKTYARGSGQAVNLSKSSIFFGSKTSNRVRKKIGRTMGIQWKSGFGRYLGLQSDFGHSKRVVFEEVRDRLESRLAGWAEQFLSQAGKEVLVKAVAMAMPNYAMSCFKLPIGCFNLAFLAKIGWRLIQNPGSLLATVLQEKYYPGKCFTEAGKGRNTSWGWKGIFDARMTSSWKSDLILESFHQDDVGPILSIPLSKTGCRDRMVWHHNANGVYSVRSGYGVAMNLMENGALGKKGRGAASDKPKDCYAWNLIWKLKGKDNAEEIMQEFAFGLWRLWKNRNEVVFNGVHRQPSELLEAWSRNILEFRDATLCEQVGKLPGGLSKFAPMDRGICRWKKPAFGILKINTDASWCKTTLRTGVGWVCRDFAGLLQGAGGSGTALCHSAAAGEAAAIRTALLACIDYGYDNVVIESDAKVIIQMIRNEIEFDFSIDCILGDIEVLARRLRSVSFSYVPRECNVAAHSVAKFVFKEGRDFGWDCIGPEFLFNILAQDVNLSIRI